MEPFALNTTNFALSKWEDADWEGGHVPLALNTASREKTMSGKEGPPLGRVMYGLGKQIQNGHAPPDVTIHIGDLSYATGYASEWDRFMAQIEPLSSRSPYMITQGNHERDYPGSGSAFQGADSGGECGIPTQMRFPMPTPSHRQDEGWYSFEQGPVHFLMLDTEMQLGNGSSQFNFVLQDLESVNRSVTPWVIVTGHRPMYSGSDSLNSGSSGYDAGNGPWWPEVESVFVHYEVDLCLWGHVHNAEVTCPLINGTCVTPSQTGAYTAPVHAVIGNAGQSLSPFCLPHKPQCCCSSEEGSCPEACDALPKWSKWRLDRFGFSTMLVQGTKELTLNFYVDCVGERDRATMKDCTAENKLVHALTLPGVKRYD